MKKQLYNIIRGIQNDKRRHEAGEKNVDLSDWPKEIIKRWLETGVIERAR